MDKHRQKPTAIRNAERYHKRQRDDRINGPSAWSTKHGGACSYCGSHNGMVEWELQFMDALPPLNDYYAYGERGWAIYTPCPYCETDTNGYREITWGEAIEMWERARRKTHDRSRRRE